MGYTNITGMMRVAYDRECRGLSCIERGALWSLTALADCKWAGEDGIVRAETMALMHELGLEDNLKGLLANLERKGRIRVLSNEDGRVQLKVCFWYDLWWNERQKSMTRTRKLTLKTKKARK